MINVLYFVTMYYMKTSKTTKKDPAKIQEPGTTTEKEIEYRNNLGTYFENSEGSTVDKLQNFTKYVPRQSLTKFISKYEIFNKILSVQGSIIECGVYMGGGL